VSRNKSNEAALKKRADFEAELARTKESSRNFPPFKFELDGHIGFEKNKSVVTLHNYFHYFQNVMEMMSPGKTEFPADLFKDDHAVEEFAGKVNLIFTQWLSKVLFEEASLFFQDVIHFVLNEQKIMPMDLRKQVNAHVKQTKQLVSKRIGLQRQGKQPAWRRSELLHAVLTTVEQTPKKERTLARCAGEMRKRYGERIPTTTDAFRKLLARHSLDWKKLKNGRIF
jgi:hypothetical protein